MYYSKSTRKLILILCHLYYRLTEESMRWLETQGKHDKVVDVITKIATVNNKTLPNLNSDTQKEVKYYNIFIYN